MFQVEELLLAEAYAAFGLGEGVFPSFFKKFSDFYFAFNNP